MAEIPFDGFEIDSNDALVNAHRQVSSWLAEAEEWGLCDLKSLRNFDLKKYKKSSEKGFLADLLVASMLRADWYKEQMPDRRDALTRVNSLVLHLSKADQILRDDQVIILLDYALKRSGIWWPRLEFAEILRRNLPERSYNSEIWYRIRKLHDGMHDDVGLEAQNARRALAALLWLDPFGTVDSGKCWSEAVRADIFAMPEFKKAYWVRVFCSIPITDNTEPSSSFMKTAPQFINELGVAEFERQLLDWLRPIVAGERVRLSMIGSHMLKGLLWFARLIESTEIESVLVAMLDTNWKNKEFVFRPLTVLAGNFLALPCEKSGPLLDRIGAQLGSKAGARFAAVLKQSRASK